MKIRRIPFLFLFLALSIVLASCTGAGAVSNWPGVSANGDTVYVSYLGSVHAVNAANGTQTWSYPEKPAATKPYYAPPAVTKDGTIVVGNYGHELHAINSSGRVDWIYTAPSGNFVATPLVTDSLVLAPSSDNTLYAVTLDGVEAWKFTASHMLWAQPVSDGTLVFVPGMDHNLYALNLADGKEVWRQDIGSALLSSPVLDADGVLYVAALEGDVVAVQSQDGSLLWRTPTGGRVWSAPALGDGTLYVANTAGKVVAIAAQDGAVQWEQNANSPIFGGPVLLEDAVVVPTEGGALVAYALDGKQELWRQAINGKLYTTPVIAGDNLVVSVLEGDSLLQTVSLNGQLAWPFSPPK